MIGTATMVRMAVASLVSALGLVGLARLSGVPVPLHDAGSGRLRLSWSARPERIEVCRTLSDKELAEREEHMRQRVECDGRFATYDLRLEVDGQLLHEMIARGAGLRHDRSLYLLREFVIAEGVHAVRVTFVRHEQRAEPGDTDAASRDRFAMPDTGIYAGRAQRERDERSRRSLAAIPAKLMLDTSLTFSNGRALVVTFDPDRKALVVLDRMNN